MLPMSDVSQGPGWWLASDGRWYAPELHPDYKAHSAAGWWQASDGRWYPPEQHPDSVSAHLPGSSDASDASDASQPEGVTSPAKTDDVVASKESESKESPNAEW